jgi:hypothetical protein
MPDRSAAVDEQAVLDELLRAAAGPVRDSRATSLGDWWMR